MTDLSLQDEHLQKALKNAPDHSLTPSDAVRKKVIAHALGHTQKQSSWFERSLQALGQWRVRSWQVAGISTVASVFIVMFIAGPQLPEEMIWRNAGDEQDIASTETLEFETKDEVLSEPMPSSQSTFSDADDTAVVKQIPKQAARKEAAPPAVTDKLAKKRVKTKPQVPAKKAEARTDAIEEEAVVTTVAPSPTIASEPSTAAEMTGETKAVIAAAPERRSARRMQEQSDLPEEGQARALGQAVSGTTLAVQDIKAGRFRILFASHAWPEGKSSVDEETGFLIELSDMPVQEVERYNKMMRDWYRKQHNP